MLKAKNRITITKNNKRRNHIPSGYMFVHLWLIRLRFFIATTILCIYLYDSQFDYPLSASPFLWFFYNTSPVMVHKNINAFSLPHNLWCNFSNLLTNFSHNLKPSSTNSMLSSCSDRHRRRDPFAENLSLTQHKDEDNDAKHMWASKGSYSRETHAMHTWIQRTTWC